MSSKFGQIQTRTAELSALERLEKSPLTYCGRDVLATLATSFLIGSSSFFEEKRTCTNALMNSNFGQIPPLTTELAVIEHLKKQCIMLWPL